MLMIAAASEEPHNGLFWALREDGNFGVVTSLTLPLSRHWVRTARSSAALAGARNVGAPYGKGRQSEVGDFSESLVVLPFLPGPAGGDWLAVGVVIGLIESAANWHHQSTNGARMVHCGGWPARMVKELITGRGPSALAWTFAAWAVV